MGMQDQREKKQPRAQAEVEGTYCKMQITEDQAGIDREEPLATCDDTQQHPNEAHDAHRATDAQDKEGISIRRKKQDPSKAHDRQAEHDPQRPQPNDEQSQASQLPTQRIRHFYGACKRSGGR